MPASVHQVELFDSRDPRVLVEDTGGGVVHQRGLIDAATAEQWFERLRDEVPWQAQRRPMYDRIVDVPRLTAGFRLACEGLPHPLREAAAVLARRTGEPFNAVGLNYYRDGGDSVALHGDKLHMLVPGHPIALISLGAIRRMTIRPKQPPRTPIHVDLESGSLAADELRLAAPLRARRAQDEGGCRAAHQPGLPRAAGRRPAALSALARRPAARVNRRHHRRGRPCEPASWQ